MTYGELKSLIADYLKRNDATAQIPGFVERARVRINDELRGRENRKTVSVTVVDGEATLPADFMELISLTEEDGGLADLEYFYAFPALTSDSQALPLDDLFLHASLADAHAWEQNAEMAQYHEDRYLAALARRNRSERAELPVRRRIRSYDSYQGAL